VCDGFSRASMCHCEVEAVVECPCGSDDREPVVCGGFGRREPNIVLLRSSSSEPESEPSHVGVCDRLDRMRLCSITILVYLYRFLSVTR
jgi:hypothetical protein